MRKLKIPVITALALVLSMAPGANAAICDKHDKHGKKKRVKTVVVDKAKKSKIKAANAAAKNTTSIDPRAVKSENHSDHSVDEHRSGHGEHHDLPAKSEQANVKMDIPDLEVVDQDNRRVKFYSDLVKGKTVAINFIFTTCTTICTPLGATFARVQKELQAAAIDDVQLISISVDPVTDTPERLKTWRAKFKAENGWTLITGEKQTIDKLLEKLSASAASRDDHSAIVLIGNDTTGQWTRTYGLAKPSQIVSLINETRSTNSPSQTLSKRGNR